MTGRLQMMNWKAVVADFHASFTCMNIHCFIEPCLFSHSMATWLYLLFKDATSIAEVTYAQIGCKVVTFSNKESGKRRVPPRHSLGEARKISKNVRFRAITLQITNQTYSCWDEVLCVLLNSSSSEAVQPFVGPWPLFQFLYLLYSR
jgi:hypothetical protein